MIIIIYHFMELLYYKVLNSLNFDLYTLILKAKYGNSFQYFF